MLDETDSGLDIDALNVVADGVNTVARSTDLGVLIITHYQRILHLVEPTRVSIMFDGRIVKEGGPELVDQLEHKGYGWIREEVAGRLRMMGILAAGALAHEFPSSTARASCTSTRARRRRRRARSSRRWTTTTSTIARACTAACTRWPPRPRTCSRAPATRVAAFVNWPARDTIFTKNVTEAINLVAYAWGRRNLGPGDASS